MQWKKGMAAALAACFLAGTFPIGALAAEGAVPETCGASMPGSTGSLDSTGNLLAGQELTPL